MWIIKSKCIIYLQIAKKTQFKKNNENNTKKIKQSIENKRATQLIARNAEKERIEAEKQRIEAEKEAENIILRAKENAKQLQITAVENSKKFISRQEEQIKQKIKAAEKQALLDVKNLVVDLSVEATKEYLIKEIDEKHSNKLVLDSSKTLNKSI